MIIKMTSLSDSPVSILKNLVSSETFYAVALGVFALWIGFTCFFITPYMMAASLAYFLMCFGIAYRRRSIRAHIIAMSAAVAIDLSLVLILEVQRDAVGTALSFKLSGFQQLHILASTLALLLYAPAIILGYRRHKSPHTNAQNRHAYWGALAFIFRTAGYILMFSMLDTNN